MVSRCKFRDQRRSLGTREVNERSDGPRQAEELLPSLVWQRGSLLSPLGSTLPQLLKTKSFKPCRMSEFWEMRSPLKSYLTSSPVIRLTGERLIGQSNRADNHDAVFNSCIYNCLRYRASKRKLTKHSQFMCIETIKILRAVPVLSSAILKETEGPLQSGPAVAGSKPLGSNWLHGGAFAFEVKTNSMASGSNL